MERLNKFLAAAGTASRRQADLLIQQGRITVNGQAVTALGTQIDPGRDQVAVDGNPVGRQISLEYLILHKPVGYLTTVRDPFDRPTVMQLLPQTNARLFPVGRLDLDTAGLLFFTNDGDLALALAHPRHLVEKIYLARVAGIPAQDRLQQLASGILLADGRTAPAKVALENVEKGNAMIRIVLREGRKRQVRRMCQAIGHPVLELQRIAMGPLRLGSLQPGEYRRPTGAEMRELVKLKEALQNRSKF